MSIVDTTTTTASPYAGWDLDAPATGSQPNRKTITFGFVAPISATEADWLPGDLDAAFAESITLTKPTLWDRILLLADAVTQSAVEPVEVLDEPTMLGRARHYLSLNTTELAEVMNVERPTIYAWLNGTAKIRKGNRERIEAIFAIAQRWWTRTHAPLGGRLHLRAGDGPSMFERLKAPELAAADIAAMVDRLAAPSLQASTAPAATAAPFATVPEAVRKATIRRVVRRARR